MGVGGCGLAPKTVLGSFSINLCNLREVRIIKHDTVLILRTSSFVSNHGADGVEAGVEAHHFALHAFGIGVVHGVLERGLAVAVLVR